MSRHSSGTRAPSTDGRLLFAATTMLVVGMFQLLLGAAAILRSEFFVATANYVYEFRLSGWGWAHLGLGALLVLTGLGLFTGALTLRVIGVTLAALSAIANFLFIPYYPVWSLLIIGFDAALIWAMTTVAARPVRDVPPPGMTASNPERWMAANESQPVGRATVTASASRTGSAEPARTAAGPSGHATTDPRATG